MSILEKLNRKKTNIKSSVASDPTPNTELAYKEIKNFHAKTSVSIKKEMLNYVDGLVNAKFKKKSDIKRLQERGEFLNDYLYTYIYWFTENDGFELDKFVAIGLKIAHFNELLNQEENKLSKFNKKEPRWFKLIGEDGEIHWDSISFLKRKSAKQAVRNFNLNYKKILNIKNIKIDLSIVGASKTIRSRISDIGSIFSKEIDTDTEKLMRKFDRAMSDNYSKFEIKEHPEIMKIMRDTNLKDKEKVKGSSIKEYKKNLEKMTELLATKYLNIL